MVKLEIPQPNIAWWVLFEANIESLIDSCAVILNLYEFGKLSVHKDAHEILNNVYTNVKDRENK